ncbi:hypothetical protein AB0K18_46305 [Nonomuraea sp. NPDC049421]|uniref:hypothetical protein n=1 Tax=Nonomuraea sp. NPDC049421 TaxID=3155275 RepID=UPI00342143B8
MARFCTAPVLDAGIEGDIVYLVTVRVPKTATTADLDMKNLGHYADVVITKR